MNLKQQTSNFKPIFVPMATKSFGGSIRPLVLIFIITTALFIAGRSRFAGWNIDTDVLIIGNLILFIVTLISFYFYTRSMNTRNPYAITRLMYGSLLVRMIVCLAAVLIYVVSAGKGVSKGAIFSCMFFYFVYTGVEVAILLKMSKQQKNA